MNVRGLRGYVAASSLAASAIIASIAGCGPQYPIEYETEHLRIAKTFDAPICAGTLRAMDLDAARISEQVGGQRYMPMEVVLGIDAVREQCGSNSTGCAGDGGPVYTEFHSFGHEMVHALHGAPGYIPFVDEGLAEALGGGLTTTHWLEVDLDNVSIADMFGPPVAYPIAGHFVAWLIQEWGLDATLNFRAALGESADFSAFASTFSATYGVSLESAELGWRTSAPSVYKLGQGDCGGPSEAWLDAQHWAGTLEVDCESETTFGPLGHSVAVEAGMYRTVLVDVLHEGNYQLSVTASRAGTLEIDSYGCGCSGGYEARDRYSLEAGSQAHEIYLERCRHRVSFLVAGIEPATAAVDLDFLDM